MSNRALVSLALKQRKDIVKLLNGTGLVLKGWETDKVFTVYEISNPHIIHSIHGQLTKLLERLQIAEGNNV